MRCRFPYDQRGRLILEEAINSASSVTQTLSGEVADGQRKLIALAAARGNSSAVNPLVTQLTNGPLGGLHEKVCWILNMWNMWICRGFRAAAVYLNAAVLHCLSLGLRHYHSGIFS
ncbi:hypothetical protein ACFX2I_006232 [Malus domestica]